MISELTKNKLYKVNLPEFKTQLYISLEQSYDDVKEFLIHLGIPYLEVSKYIDYGLKGSHIKARTTLFKDNNIVLIKMHYFDNNIRSIVILIHEIVHAAKRILDMYELSQNRELENREEAECYLTEYIFEEMICYSKPYINYNKEYRNKEWLYEITHKLKED